MPDYYDPDTGKWDPNFAKDVADSIAAGSRRWPPTPEEIAEAERIRAKFKITPDELLSGLEANGATPATPIATLKLRTMAELRNLPASDASWIVERFLAEGAITELTAWIKAGKSTLLAQLIAAVLQNKPFLNLFTVDPGPVVLLTEERPSSLLAALDAIGVSDDDKLHIGMWFEQSTLTWGQAVADAAKFAREIKAKVLAVDTLGRWAGVDDENDAAKADLAMAPLQRETQGFAAIVLRQAGKSLRETQNAGRGSSAYGGAADIILSMQHHRDESGKLLEDDPTRSISVISRFERDVVPRMQLRYEGGRYQALSSTEVVDTDSCNAVQRDLQRHGPSRPYDVTQRTGMRPGTVRSALYRLRRREEVELIEGRYESRVEPATPEGPLHLATPLRGVDAKVQRAGCRSDDKQPPGCSKHIVLLDVNGRCPVSGQEVSDA
jgi:hypothetical protein